MTITDLKYQSLRRSPEDQLAHMNSFELEMKFSAGIWYMSPATSRFHDRYKPELSIEARLDMAAGLAGIGLKGMEAHYPNEINEKNLDLWKAFSRDTGIRVISIGPQLFYGSEFEFGSLSSPIAYVRRKAVRRMIETLEINREMDTDFSVVWSGIDGFENTFGLNHMESRMRFVESMAEAMDAVPGVRIAFEPKPYEPRGRHLFGTTPEGLLLNLQVENLLVNRKNRELLDEGLTLSCLNPEIGHMMMAYEDLAYTFSQVMEYGRLAHIHFNSQPQGNYDQDLNVGVIAPEQLEAALYILKMHGYRGFFGIDINPERMSVKQGIQNSMDAIRAASDRINEMDHEKIIRVCNNPDKDRGWLEAYLIRMRALRPDKLPPLPELPE